ncbi:MAG: hypothetical protein ACRDZM_08785 [Acidimicrobiia bacterium]
MPYATSSTEPGLADQSRVWLVLTEATDPDGAWLTHGLQARGLDPILHLTTDDLVEGATWAHTIGEDGAGFTVRLADGTTIRSEQVAGVVNRIGYITQAHAIDIVDSDRESVLHELNAFFMSWLTSVRAPILNPPSARGLAGAWRPRSEWAYLAAQVGLHHMPVPSSDSGLEPLRLGAEREGLTAITVAGGIVDNGLGEEMRQAALGLADLAETPLLGIEFVMDGEGDLVLAGVTPQPSLQAVGEAVIDAIGYALGAGAT